MADEKLDLTKLHTQIGTSRSADYKTIYINSTRMGVSPWDVRITLGQVIEGPDGKQVNEEQITVVMSPAQAKSFLGNLATTIAKFEEAFGEIKDMAKIVASAAPQTPKPKIKKID